MINLAESMLKLNEYDILALGLAIWSLMTIHFLYLYEIKWKN